jgi:hypothetical protein
LSAQRKPKSQPSPAPVEQPKKKATLLQMVTPPPSPKGHLLLPSADSKGYAKAWRLSSIYLQGCLPPGSQNLYTARKYGNHIGIPIVCPYCGDKPPKEIRQGARWRWMAFHEMTYHRGGK